MRRKIRGRASMGGKGERRGEGRGYGEELRCYMDVDGMV